MPFDGHSEDTTVTTLREARAMISVRSNWHQGRLSDDAGVARCAAGWVYECDGNPLWGSMKYRDAAMEYLVQALPPRFVRSRTIALTGELLSNFAWIVAYNDSWFRRHRQIVALFDRAIALAEADA